MVKRFHSKRAPVRNPDRTSKWLIAALIVLAALTLALAAYAMVRA